ncbi:hypothetical protein GZ77_07805 [Endozoicomonas montiporae]|uniref:Cysteine dioxygenase n=2 Tax=Endozoicomonas montiporae TaxID=1027273 RepID=A0A081N780_9GAMM|nr:hypothetical protein [Endozoicomonas montiporae]AMO55874.1 hypothetical protein EZMO1_1725 [Endozoicomonas montiporae CL-33]KEQ14303.1 hypothetical protein GZ77_07805 [Endozoicomonas montiporae]
MTGFSDTRCPSVLFDVDKETELDASEYQRVICDIAAKAERLQSAGVNQTVEVQEAYVGWVMSRLNNALVPVPDPAGWQDHPRGENVRVFRHRMGSVEFCHLKFGSNGSIPYHDHCDSNGVMRVVEGSVASSSFNIVEQSSANMTLTSPVHVRLSAGDMTSFCLQRNSVHALAAGADGAYILDVFTRLNDDACCRYLQLQPPRKNGYVRAVWSQEG